MGRFIAYPKRSVAMKREDIISKAFSKLGNNGSYNANGGERYQKAVALLDSFYENIATDTTFLFNAITVKLTSTGQNEQGEYRYNVPIDCLNVINCQNINRGLENYREEGEFIYSLSSELFIHYCKKLDFDELPDKLFNLLVCGLAKELSLAFNAYNDRYQLLDAKYQEEKRNIIYQQGFNHNVWE